MTDMLEQVLQVRKAEYEAEKLESEKRRQFDKKQADEKLEFELGFFIPRVKTAIEKAILAGKFRVDVPFRDVGFHRRSCLENTDFVDSVSVKDTCNELSSTIRLLEDSGYYITICGACDNKFSLEWAEKRVRTW